jgi:hypothetical protein
MEKLALIVKKEEKTPGANKNKNRVIHGAMTINQHAAINYWFLLEIS